METIKIHLNQTALRVIAIVAVCLSIIASTVLFVNSRSADRKAEVITDCFNVAKYKATNSETKSEVQEPILRFFKTCMQLNGYGSDYTFLNE